MGAMVGVREGFIEGERLGKVTLGTLEGISLGVRDGQRLGSGVVGLNEGTPVGSLKDGEIEGSMLGD